MSFKFELQEILNKYNLLNHELYQYWNQGKLYKETLKEYAKQYYHHVEAFPRALSGIHSLCNSKQARKIILENLIEEENSKPNHPELWVNFAQAIDVAFDDLDNVVLNKYTKSLLNCFTECSRDSHEKGLGALCAHEWQYSEIAKTKKDGLKKFYNINNEESLEFFTVHSEIDVWHKEQLEELVKNIPENKVSILKEGAERAAKALWEFLDGILEYHNKLAI